MEERISKYTDIAINLKTYILKEFKEELSQPSRSNYIDILKGITKRTLNVTDFKVPGWRSTNRLVQLNDYLKQLKVAIKEIQKRDYLSITPKVEDIKVVYKWIENFNVPHFYFQVFFDKIYGISFEKILEIIADSNNEGVIFSIEEDIKNQNKTTIKINSKAGVEVAYKVKEPKHKSVRKEMERGRLLFYVTFSGGTAFLDVDNLKSILNLKQSF